MLRLLFCVSLIAMAGQASAQERQWTLDSSDKQVFLVFGVPDTADVGVSFWCDIGTPKVSLFVPLPHSQVRPGERRDISAHVDGKLFSFKGRAEKDAATGLINVEAPFQQNDAFLKAVAAGEILDFDIDHQHVAYPLADADFAGFKSACAGDEVN